MLISFSVGNYLSFKNIQTIDFTPESLKEHEDFLHIPYLYHQNARILKSIGVFGHNSHGKSNLLKAYQFFLDLIFSSFTIGRVEEAIVIDNYKLSTETLNEPSHFEVIFYHRQVKYRYGFKILSTKVVEEWLYYSEAKIRENYLFERSEQEFRVSKAWNKESENKIDHSLFFTKRTNLLLSVLISQGTIPRINEISTWMRGNLVISDITTKEHLSKAVLFLSHPKYRTTINRFIERADLGFVTIVEKIDSHVKNKVALDKDFLELIFSTELTNYEIFTKHDIYNAQYKCIDSIQFELMKSESSGTIKYLVLVCYLSYAIKQGQLILIDEIDSKFHVLLFRFLLKIFHDKKINTFGSQMIFTTHSTFIMSKSVLRRDQMVIVEKDQYGESIVTRMHGAKKPIRIDTQIEKEYIKGDLGGVSGKLKSDEGQSELDF